MVGGKPMINKTKGGFKGKGLKTVKTTSAPGMSPNRRKGPGKNATSSTGS